MRSWVVSLVVLVCAAAGRAQPAVEAQTRPAGPVEDLQAVLHNPDTGWVLQEVYPILEKEATLRVLPDYDFPGIDHVMLTCTWADIEETRGDYRWAAIDYAYDYWKKRGKSIQLRISTESYGIWNHLHRSMGVPQYVLDAIPPAQKQVRKKFVKNSFTVVDARNPFYQERLSAFLAALAKHFSPEGPRPVVLVDLLGFGLWGEWHTGFQYENLQERRKAMRIIIDAWVKAFGHQWLALSYSHDPDFSPDLYKGPVTHYDPAATDTYQDYLACSAFDYALTIPSIAFRRNGCAGVVSSNERKFAEEYYRRPDGGLMVSELVSGYLEYRPPSNIWPFKDIRSAIDDCLSLHPNYITIPGWDGERAKLFMDEQPEVVKYGLLKMGYRYVPTSVQYPAKVRDGSEFTLDVDWVNRGVGKAVQDYDLNLVMRKTEGTLVGRQLLGRLRNRLWLCGEVNRGRYKASVQAPAAGRYGLYLEMIDPRSGRHIQMPLKGELDGGYPIGLVDVGE